MEKKNKVAKLKNLNRKKTGGEIGKLNGKILQQNWNIRGKKLENWKKKFLFQKKERHDAYTNENIISLLERQNNLLEM